MGENSCKSQIVDSTFTGQKIVIGWESKKLGDCSTALKSEEQGKLVERNTKPRTRSPIKVASWT